jgi:fluoride exporter
MDKLLAVGIGGFFGATARYGAGLLVLRLLPATFPFATFLVNVSGCFLIGVLGALADRAALGDLARVFWITGVLGGYTTFSAFGYESLLLLRGGQAPAALANVLGQVVLGLLAVWAGTVVARYL